MAAVFAIGLDAFPLDANDKLPLDYFLKYLCTTMSFPYSLSNRAITKTPSLAVATGCAITIPLVLIAFNLPRLGAWWSQGMGVVAQAWSALPASILPAAAVLVIEVVVVAAIWTAPLAAGIKAAVTACVSVLVAVAVAVCVLWAWGPASLLKWRGRGGSVSSSASSSGLGY